MIYGVWSFFGFNTVIFLAGLGSIPQETYEAASIDGATKWAQFRHITLPLLSPTLYFLTLYSVIGTFKAFNHIYVLRTARHWARPTRPA
jgi:multiple sugar transport system permease protein